jgi:trans-2,3-dihydro-3-hydroxyanthranilate isomerase
MLSIAREMNLSETAFVRQSTIADFGVRYFTPAEEIPLAGHPTIATTFALVDSGRLQISAHHTTITLELQVGHIPVEIYASDGEVQRIIMNQKKPRFLGTHDPEIVVPIFGLKATDLLPDVPIQTVSTGTPQLMIPIQSLDSLRSVVLDITAYNAYRARSDFFSPHLFCLNGVTPLGQTFSRHFGTPPDLMEDPFTGSATGGMAAFLWRYGLISESSFTAEQGHWMARPGSATVEIIGPPEDIQTIKVGGSAITVLQGEFII